MNRKQMRVFAWVFCAAGIYNLLWGVLAAVNPQWLFDLADLPRLNHPQIFQCLGMVVGVYGLLYLEVARRPKHGFAIIAVGLLGKVLGPIGWAQLYFSGQWPLESMVLILTNDLIWWIPFAVYLFVLFPSWYQSFGKSHGESDL